MKEVFVSPDDKPNTATSALTTLLLAAMVTGYTSTEPREMALVTALVAAVLTWISSR